MVGAGLDVRVLGAVEARRDGQILRLGGRRQRALLAILILDNGDPVAADRIVDELWHGEPPSGASTLPSYVSRLRATLGSEAMLESTQSGYRLILSPDRVDVTRFERLVSEGRSALAKGKVRRAREHLGTALTLWRGRPFGDLGDDGVLQIEARRLEELHLLALEGRIETDLALGASADLIDEIEALLQSHPYRERLWAQLMTALYRAQRQADALAAYQRARVILVEELGLEPGPPLRELELAILRHDLPELSAPDTRHNLPTPLTSFVGRETELVEIERLLDDTRLLTLTGVGGVGKTRLGLESARRVLLDMPDGVWFVDLSDVPDGSLVGRDVALAMGLGELPAIAAVNALADHVRSKQCLLVLDNCEHLRIAVSELLDRLLPTSPRLRVLATSLEPFGVAGEVDYPVAPMPVPSADAALAEIRASDAVQLLLGLARTARPHLLVDDQFLATAARIARDLDGLPLAIELAAARAKALTLDDIADRLADRFRFLVSWRRVSPARHRTLRETMAWSFELLSPEERQLLARLSVFAGEFTLESVARVCLDGDEDLALALVERLVAASLVVPEERDSEMRYRLLETVRQYAAERLDEPTTEHVRRAHAQYFLRLAERADLTAARRGAGQRLDLAIAAQDNLRRALAWAVETGAVAFGLELATSLERFWVTHDPREGMRWFAELFGRPEASTAPRAVRANALRAYGGSADMAGEFELAQALWEESLSTFRELGDEADEAFLLHRLAISAQRRGDLPRAKELVDASHRIHDRLGNRWGMAGTLGTSGAIARDEGDDRRARELLEVSLGLAREVRVTWWVGGTLAELANLSLAIGDVDEADRQSREALRLAVQMRDRAGLVFGVGLQARIAAERGDASLAAQLWAAVEREDAGAPLGGWRRHRERYREHLARILPESVKPPEETPTLDEAVALVLADTAIGGSSAQRASHPSPRMTT